MQPVSFEPNSWRQIKNKEFANELKPSFLRRFSFHTKVFRPDVKQVKQMNA